MSSSSRPFGLVFFGLPLAALLLHRDGHAISLACLCRDDAVGIRRLKRVLGSENVLMKPDARDPALLERVRSLKPDLLVSWFWTQRLPMELVNAARLGGIGVHPSLLPRHRGPDPYFWAIDMGDRETGVSVHRLFEAYDTGDVLAQERLPIDARWNAWQLAKALDRPSLKLLREVLGKLSRGERVLAVAQDEALATEAPFPSEDDYALRLHWPADKILRRIRALSPAPGASLELGDHTLTVLRAERAAQIPSGLRPGEVISPRDGSVMIGAQDGAIRVLEGEIDGERVAMDDLSRLVRRLALLCSPGPEEDE